MTPKTYIVAGRPVLSLHGARALAKQNGLLDFEDWLQTTGTKIHDFRERVSQYKAYVIHNAIPTNADEIQ